MQKNSAEVIVVKAKKTNLFSQFAFALIVAGLLLAAYHMSAHPLSPIATAALSLAFFISILSQGVRRIEISDTSIIVFYMTGIKKSIPTHSILSAKIIPVSWSRSITNISKALQIETDDYFPFRIYDSTFTSDELIKIQDILVQKIVENHPGIENERESHPKKYPMFFILISAATIAGFFIFHHFIYLL